MSIRSEYQKKYRKKKLETSPDSAKEEFASDYQKRKEYYKEYYQKRKALGLLKAVKKEKRASYDKKYKNNKKSSIEYFLRESISDAVRFAISKSNGKKGGKILLKYLNYSINDLKIHIESQFEYWMNWNNRGKYNPKEWKDNDSTTWKWQLDHIIPQAILPYASMEDDNFKKCWELKNLRPYSAKQNIIDGANRIRHKNFAEYNNINKKCE